MYYNAIILQLNIQLVLTGSSRVDKVITMLFFKISYAFTQGIHSYKLYLDHLYQVHWALISYAHSVLCTGCMHVHQNVFSAVVEYCTCLTISVFNVKFMYCIGLMLQGKRLLLKLHVCSFVKQITVRMNFARDMKITFSVHYKLEEQHYFCVCKTLHHRILQPLMDNLESQTYEVFEKDPVKYSQYQKVQQKWR